MDHRRISQRVHQMTCGPLSHCRGDDLQFRVPRFTHNPAKKVIYLNYNNPLIGPNNYLDQPLKTLNPTSSKTISTQPPNPYNYNYNIFTWLGWTPRRSWSRAFLGGSGLISFQETRGHNPVLHVYVYENILHTINYIYIFIIIIIYSYNRITYVYNDIHIYIYMHIKQPKFNYTRTPAASPNSSPRFSQTETHSSIWLDGFCWTHLQ